MHNNTAGTPWSLAIICVFFAVTLVYLPILTHAQEEGDTTPPAPPVLTTPETNGYDVQGTAEGGSTVVLSTPSGASCTTQVAPAFASEPLTPIAFQCTLSQAGSDGEAIFGKTIDAAGNESAEQIIGTIRNATSSPGFQEEGIFDCAGGQYAMPVGTLSAIGGVYVPVNDAAVTLNTGYLLYKECVLDVMVSKLKQAATKNVTATVINFVATGDDGRPLWPENLKIYLQEHRKEVTENNVSETNTKNICEPYRNEVRVSIAKDYIIEEDDPKKNASCSIDLSSQELSSFVKKADFSTGGWSAFLRFTNPANYALGARVQYWLDVEKDRVDREQERMALLSQGNGYNPKEVLEDTENGLVRKIVVPGFLVSRQLEQVTTSGFRQMENVSEIGQLIDTAFYNLGTEILTSPQGLSGLAQAVNGGLSYLDKLVSSGSASVRQATINTVLTSLTSSLAVERSYNAIKSAILALLENAAEQLRAAEDRCWELMIPAVENYAQQAACTTDSAGTTTCGTPIPFTVATSTIESSAVIDGEIQPLIDIAKEDVATSTNSLALIERLIKDITASNSPDIQRNAIQKWDEIAASGDIHTAYDVQTAQGQQTNVQTSISNLVEDTITAWGSGTGWCNSANTSVVASWFSQWRDSP